MADDDSRLLWNLDDDALLTHFNSHYPQHTSWILRTLPPTIESALTGDLSRKRRVPESLCNAASPLIPLSASGRPFAPILASSHPVSRTARPPAFLFSNSLPIATAPRASLPPSRRPVRSRTVEDALRSVGQAFTRLGTTDPRLNEFGEVDFRLASLLRAWKKADAPPARIKPLPLQLVHAAVHLATTVATPLSLSSAADCLVIGFYFLLRPGEYVGVPRHQSDDLFRLQDVGLCVGTRKLDILHCPLADLLATTFATLTFTSQKNGVRGETIGHSRSGHPSLCPVLCLVSRGTYLRHQAATPSTTSINAIMVDGTWSHLLPSHVTHYIRAAVALHPDLGFTASDVSARSTRAGGAMALLCAGIDGDRIRLIGRWKSDEMYRYLHVPAQPVMTGIAAAMFRSCHYRILPGSPLPTLPVPPH